ncbi:MAG: helix-turn-helix domain-containing protein [Pseudomonadota bacterium]
MCRDGGELTLREIPLPGIGQGSLVLLQERAVVVTPGSFQSLSVTPREREVLTWLAAGKTEREIGAILGISPRTVQKHLERLYVKLGVETRTAAVMRSLALVAPPAGQRAGG